MPEPLRGFCTYKVRINDGIQRFAVGYSGFRPLQRNINWGAVVSKCGHVGFIN